MINDHYTTSLYTLMNNFYTRQEIESWFSNYNLSDYLTEEQILSIEHHGLWSKEKLAKKIVDHYLMQEIGFETPALFKHYAKLHMQEVMEKYLPLVYSSSIEYDPLVNVDYTETFERNIAREGSNQTETSSTGSSSSESSNSGTGLNVSSDTPMTNVNKADILAGNYASGTSATENSNSIEDSTSSTTTSSGNSSDDENVDENYTKRVKGNSGVSATAQKMVEQYRDNIIAIDKEIIDSCESLFMIIF